MESSGTVTVTPELRVSWQHEYLDEDRTIHATLDNGAGPSFAVAAQRAGRDAVFGGAGVNLTFGRFGAYVFYNPEFGSDDLVSHTVSGGIRLRF
jgi:outer membrane autotransporter protein